MKWEHDCSLEWMQARQECLTASDVKDLLPFTATGRTRKITDETRLKVLARKMVTLTKDDCHSVGAAARGHILEPYALDHFNENVTTLYHWDDMVIRNSSELQTLAFSPDACDIEMTDIGIVQRTTKNQCLVSAFPKVIGEIKCYSPEKHLLAGYTKPSELEERWQIATAMAACRSIEKAYLIFYNPSMKKQMFVAVYERRYLEKEIEAIKEVEREWLSFLKRRNVPYLDSFLGDSYQESKIIEGIERSKKLNPI